MHYLRKVKLQNYLTQESVFLFFTDYLVVLSLAQNRLQEKVDILEKYSRQWD